MNTPNSKLIEHRFKETIDAYVETGRPTGSFIQCVLENDLAGAIGRADLEAMDNLRHIVAYLYNEVPGGCWGSKQRVKEWLEMKQQEIEAD